MRYLCLSLFACLLPIRAAAQTVVPELDQGGRRGEIARMVHERALAQFEQADANKDGRLSRDEVAGVSPYKAETFETYDKDKDGTLSWQEFVGHDRWKKE